MAQPTKKRAIELIESSKRTHEHWVAWHLKYPYATPYTKDGGGDYPAEAGNLRFHQKCIEEYDYVLEYIRRSKKGKAPRA